MAVAALILGVFVAVGVPAKVGARTASAVCVILHSDGACGEGKRGTRHARQEGTGKTQRQGTGPGQNSDGSRSSGDASGVARNCRSVWGCYWWATKRFVVGGVWADLKDQGTGIKRLFTNFPSTAMAMLRGFRGELPDVQGKRASRTCSPGAGSGGMPSDMLGCADSSLCLALSAIPPPVAYCTIKDMVLDPGAKQDIRQGRYLEAGGRIWLNGLEVFLPTKIPFGKLGGRLITGVSRTGKVLTRAGRAADVLDRLRGARAFDRALSASELRGFTNAFRSLSPAQRTAFLAKLTPEQLARVEQDAERVPNLESDLLASAPKDKINYLNRNDPILKRSGYVKKYDPVARRHGSWTREVDGNLSNEKLTPEDIKSNPLVPREVTDTERRLAGEQPSPLAGRLRQNPANNTVTAEFPDGVEVTFNRTVPINGAGAPLQQMWDKAVATRAGGYGSAARVDAGTMREWFTGPESVLDRLRGEGAFDRVLSPRQVADFTNAFKELNPAQRTAFLGELTPSELERVDLAAERVRNLRPALLVAAPRNAIKYLNRHDPTVRMAGTGLRDIHGDLFAKKPTPKDVRFNAVTPREVTAAVLKLVKRNPAKLEEMMTQHPNGIVEVKFADGEIEAVDSTVPALGAKTDWQAILEEAIAQRAGGYGFLPRVDPGTMRAWLIGK